MLAKETEARRPSLNEISTIKDIQGDHQPSVPTESFKNYSVRQTTLIFICTAAYEKAFPGQSLNILSSYRDGVYCEDFKRAKLEASDIEKLSKTIHELITGPSELKIFQMPRKDFQEYLQKKNYEDKLQILKLFRNDPVNVAQIEDFIDYTIEPLTSDKQILLPFEINSVEKGFVIRYPFYSSPGQLQPFVNEPSLNKIIHEYKEWQNLVECSTVSELNRHILKGSINEVKWVSENLHNKKLFELCYEIIGNYPKKRVLTLAGPSSSNKTTVSLRLNLALQAMGYKTLVISMDDYYKAWKDILKDEEGKYNFEDMSAINLDALQETFHSLLAGKVTKKRRNFFNGKGGIENDETFVLADKQFIVIEGILALHEEFIKVIGEQHIYRVFIHPYCLVQIDRHHIIRNSDCRLIKRIVRDYKFRNILAEETVSVWKKVRFSEEVNIFPYLPKCDFIFNTSLIYELPVLAKYAKFLLLEIDEKNENNFLVNKLLFILSLFYPFDDDRKVPGISFLREFIGGSDLDY